jgi:hypothetical protein
MEVVTSLGPGMDSISLKGWEDPVAPREEWSVAVKVDPNAPQFSGVARLIREVCTDLADFLIRKNVSYGNSALDPVRIFSKANAEEQLLVRIDDKLSRLARGHTFADEDTIKDLLGYLVLLAVAKRLIVAKRPSNAPPA